MLPPVLLSSVLLLLIAHIRLRPVCFRSSLTTKAVPRRIITNPESNDAVHGHLNDNIMVATTHMFDFRCHLIDMIIAYLFVFAGWVMSIALFNMHSASAHIALGLIE
jgi:hypothetical protein